MRDVYTILQASALSRHHVGKCQVQVRQAARVEASPGCSEGRCPTSLLQLFLEGTAPWLRAVNAPNAIELGDREASHCTDWDIRESLASARHLSGKASAGTGPRQLWPF